MTNIFDELKAKTLEATEVQQAEVDELTRQLQVATDKLSTLLKAYKAFSGERASKRSSNGKESRVKGGIRSKILELLDTSPTAMDLGQLTKEIYGEDNQKTRARTTAALVYLTKGADSPVRRVGTGSYTSREVAQHA